MKQEKFTAVILAAGKGVRMRSPLPKVLHLLKGKPLIYYVVNELMKLRPRISQIVVVVGYGREKVVEYLNAEFKGKQPKIEFVVQKKIIGTADAVKTAKSKVRCKQVLVLCGDAPLITANTLADFIAAYDRDKVSAGVISAHVKQENQLGVIVRDEAGRVQAIRERIVLDGGEKYTEVNSGAYAFDREVLFGRLNGIGKNSKKGEYFLTDIIEDLYNSQENILGYTACDSREILGINDFRELLEAESIMQKRIIDELIGQGVKVLDPQTTFIEAGVKIGPGTVIFPFTYIEKDVIIGAACQLGPFIHVRGNTRVKDNTHLGNFLEVNRCQLGRNVKAKHFGYLGDAVIGDNTNVGAGTVVANYDGKQKHKTVIGQDSFIGSDTVLVAPVKVGKRAKTGAGCVVTHNVGQGQVVVGVPARALKKKGS